MWEELKACLSIAYTNCEGTGEWEPARMMVEGTWDWESTHTDQIDVTVSRFSTLIPKTPACGGLARS